jgi:hypothetical protein
MDWDNHQFIIFRVLSDTSISLIFILMFGNLFIPSDPNDKIKLQNTYNKVQRIIYIITFLLCLLDAFRIEIQTSNLQYGMFIAIAGSFAQSINYFFRKQYSLKKKVVISFFFILGIGIIMFEFFYEWITTFQR